MNNFGARFLDPMLGLWVSVAAAEAVGAGLGGAIAGGAAGGAIAGAGNYATQSFINGSDMSLGGAWDATWKGAAAGAIGGGVGGAVGPGAYGALAGGFSGGATGSALNGGSGWDVLKGGLMGAGMAMASYSAIWVENYGGSEVPNFKTDGEPLDVPKKANGSFEADDYLKQANKILVDA